MRKTITFLAMVIVPVLITTSLWAARPNQVNPNDLSPGQLARLVYQTLGPDSVRFANYVGSEVCLACHSGPRAINGRDFSGWRDTFHARPFKAVPTDQFSMVTGMGIVADADRNGIDDFIDGLDFNDPDITVFQGQKPNAPILGYSDQTGYTVTMGPTTVQVFFAWGGNGLYKQRFVARIPLQGGGFSEGTYVLPLQFNEVTYEWVPYHPENWYDGNVPIFDANATAELAAQRGRSFDKRCAGCHFTGTQVRQSGAGEYVASAAPVVLFAPDAPNFFDYNGDGIREEVHIGCESCHGGGSLHVIMHGDPTLIVKPVQDLDAQQANAACGICHLRGGSSTGALGFPWDDAQDHGFYVGDDVAPYVTETPGLWPDGRSSRQHHQQWQDFLTSSKPTFQFHQVTCSECHDLHLPNLHNIREQIVEGTDAGPIVIDTRVEDNTLCLACHATFGPFAGISKEMVADYEANQAAIGMVVSSHTRHPYGPDRLVGLSRCTECHMPLTAKSAINYDIHSHTFEAISPAKTLLFQAQGGMPNSCSVRCHRNIINILPNQLDANIGNWTEETDIRLAEWLAQRFEEWFGHDEEPMP